MIPALHYKLLDMCVPFLTVAAAVLELVENDHDDGKPFSSGKKNRRGPLEYEC